jgi:hypothetical protein
MSATRFQPAGPIFCGPKIQTQFQKPRSFSLNSSHESPVLFTGKRSWRTILGTGLLGLATLFPIAGCTTEAGRMDREFGKIPAVQVENRFEFLNRKMSHENAKVRVRVFEHLSDLQVPSRQKIPLILRGLDDSNGDVMLSAMKAGQKIADNPEQTLARVVLGILP